MPFVTVNDLVLHYRIAGRAGLPRIVFLNSLGSDLRIWEEVCDRLKDRFEILLYDMRGHGLSEVTPAPYSIARLVGDLTGLMDALGWDRAGVVGLSIGGLVAQHVAIHAPERIACLVLMDTAARIGTRDGWNERIAAVDAGGVAAIADAVAQRWFSQGFAASAPAVFAGWRRMLEATPAAGYAGASAAVRDADYTDRLDRITVPTLVLAGEEDAPTPPDLVRATADGIPGATFALVPGAGHLPCLERPRAVADHIATHVESHGGSAGNASRFDSGLRVRRAVLGEAHVERANAMATPFDAAFQRFITEGAWGTVWAGRHFSRRERSIVTIALLAALGHDEEVALHVRATRNTGASNDDIAEAMMHVAVYAGVPAANNAIRIAKKTLAEMEEATP